MENEGRVAVVIVNYNGEAYLADCLGALSRQTFRDFFVVLFDNGSTDGSIELVEREYPEVELIRSGVNLGFAAGNNRAIERALAGDLPEYVLTLNNDVVLGDRCLELLVDTMDSSPDDVWSCQPKMYFFDDGSGERLFNNAGIVVWRDGSAFNRGINQTDRGQYDHDTDIFGTCAGASLYRRSALEEVGLFDEDFFTYLEDVDIAWRGRLAGYRSLLCPGAVCRHRHGASGVDPAGKISRLERNRVWVLLKNYSVLDIIISPLFTLYRYARLALAGLSKGKAGRRLGSYKGDLSAFALLTAVVEGALRGFMGMPECIRRRRRFKNETWSGSNARSILRRYSTRLSDAVNR